MKLNNLTYIVLELNAALDTGKYDELQMQEASQHIQSGDVVQWLQSSVPDADLSLLAGEAANEYQSALAEIYGAYAGNERRKWGVERRALCLLIAWTNELIQQRRWEGD
jgi:hypothetical protein